ncbi:hypothetical protein F5Y16DRAFT_343508 [Xylariaceae sp. FL0255]|nr:hypothetical protein F5Y16DRAFT_343508 [Xylariaceae sp. FL0255]
MRFFTTVAAVLAATQGAFAVDIQKAVIVNFPSDTPNDVVSRAMTEIRQAGGTITHEYRLIKAFAAKAPAKILETLHAWSTEYNAVIEEDQVIEISHSS